MKKIWQLPLKQVTILVLKIMKPNFFWIFLIHCICKGNVNLLTLYRKKGKNCSLTGIKTKSNSKWHDECMNRLFLPFFLHPGTEWHTKKWSEKLVKEQWHNAPCIKRELLFYSGYNTVVRRSTLSFLVLACALYVSTCRHISGRHMYVALLHID